MKRTWSCWALVGLVVAFGLTYSSIAQAQQVVINEIHYRPNDPAASPPEDIEFLELYNTGAAPLDISGWRFNQGVTYAFPAGTTIAANGFVLVSKNGALLQATVTIPVGVPVFTWTTGQSLENAGEAVQLVNAANAVIDLVTYRDGGAWPEEPDGGGPSLELTSPANDNAYGQMWRASLGLNGTPGAVNSRYTEAPLVLWEEPVRSSLTPNLTQVRVTFSEPVSGVAAADLTVAGAPATAVSCVTCTGGVGAGPYTFTGFPVPALPRFTVQLAPGAIQDGASNSFGGDSWTYRTSLPKIVINEIHYNPKSSSGLEEFLELHNWGTEAIDIGRWRVVDFADPGCEFPAGTIVPAGGYVVCAKDPATLLAATGYSTPYSWGASDSLSNGGETVRLIDDALITIDIVPYDDAGGWPTDPDGGGPSLELRNPTFDNVNPASWRSSLGMNGTPGAQNSTYISAPVVSGVTPGRGTVAPALTQIEVTFSEPVIGVSADDLTVNAVQATGVTGSGAGPYVFTVADSPAARMDVILATGGIQNAGGTPFGGDRWIYFDHAPRVAINELHYHPADGAVGPTEDAEQLQFLELYNADSIEFDLAGWSTSGVTYRLPPGTTLAPGAFLLLAKDEAFLRSKLTIPVGVTVLQWTSGDLSNGGETILLSDADGNLVDQLTYDDEGLWPMAADGTGPSLELLNPGLPNEHGSAWRPSLAWNGTPGAANSVYDPAPAPVISQPAHAPAIPLPGQAVTISVTVVDDGAAPPTVTLYHRLDANDGNFHNPNAYASVAMLDDGLHGDGAAGDLRYGAVVGGLADGQQLDFYITAGDGVKTAVAPTLHDTPNAKGNPSQTYLAKFSSEVLPTDFPVYHILVTLANKQWQESLTGEIEMKMDFDSTFIDDQLNVYYNVIERYRGQSSISTQPRSYRVDLPSDRPMDSPLGFPARKLQFNGHFALRQRLGYELFRAAGIPAPRTAWVRLRYTGVNYDTSYIGSSAHRGLYALVERIDSDFMDSQDGLVVPPRGMNSDGSLYRGEHDANLRWEGWDPNAYRTDADGRNGYSKENNEEQDYWDDLIPMIDALNNYPDPEYAPRVAARVDEEEWGGFYALHTVLGNREGGIYRDTGDDYYMGFNPPGDPNGFNCQKIPWDLDAVLTDGNETIWRQNVAAVSRFLRHDAFAPYYLSWLRRLLANEFSQAQMDALIDAQPAGAFAPSGGNDTYPETRQQYKNWTASRRAFVENELKDALTVTGIPASPYTGTNAVLSLSGNLEQGFTFAVTINGQPADPNFHSGTWAGTHTLTPGMNTIVVAALDRDGAVLQQITNQVFYNPPGTQHDSLRLILPKRMYNQKTMTIAADIIDVAGGVNWKVWEAVGTVTVVRLPDRVPVAITTTNFDPHVNDPNGSIRFYNGRGSVSFTLNDGAAAPAGTYELTVSVTVSGQPLTGTATITVLSAPAFRTLSGTLSGANLTWGPDEEIHLTGSV
ncbi:MAG: lamin tail domain-containing protein, partial [Acidobacteria bacterium]|nr:lamin tail domain-containing protein [Acidobacteriota bacterium]